MHKLSGGRIIYAKDNKRKEPNDYDNDIGTFTLPSIRIWTVSYVLADTSLSYH